MSKDQVSKAVPAGAYVVDNTVEYMPPKAEAPPASEQSAAPAEGEAAPAAGESTPAAGESTPAAGETPTPEAKVDPNNELLGSIAQTLQQITAKLDQAPAGTEQQTGPDPAVELENQLLAIQEQARDGKITYEEMLAQTAPIIREQAVLAVRQETEAKERQGQVQAAQGQFMQDYPDFQAFAGSPEAQAFVQSNPVFDHVSAFFAAREQKVAAEKSQLEAQVAELQKQIQSSIKNAAKEQSSVVGEGGNDVGVPTTYRGDGLDPQKGGITALQRARATLK